MVDVRRVKLPGVGVLHTFITDDGGKVGVIAHRSGHSDLITFADDEGGPDASKVSHLFGPAAGGDPEERRITYVALSRARDRLFICIPTQHADIPKLEGIGLRVHTVS